ncbi:MULTISPECIES: MFS transporter [unclassified Adlercreutzia]|uniref:MFS transporter n=1 Tax=unclassified Adlercreutzia TaxID=2636013 RepID=UPI0013EAFD4B|nr:MULTISPECIES: MFS transporter [unclassified Adlercreutzia]
MRDETKATTVPLKGVIGILALYCVMGEFTILTPSIAAFARHFAGTPITTIMFANSITGIVSVPMSILSGAVLAKVGFKRAAVVGTVTMSLGGALPFLLPSITDYTYVIVSRIIVGIGLGIVMPVGSATIVAFFEGEERSRLLGYGTTIQFVFALVYTTAAGFLTEIQWNYPFLAYLIGLGPLCVSVAWMPEAKARARSQRLLCGPRGATAKRMPGAVWGYAAFTLVAWTCVTTVQVITSTVLDVRGLAGPGEAALVINCCGIGSIVSGLVFLPALRMFGTRLFGASAVLVGAGLVPCLLASSSVAYALGVFMLGLGGSTFFTAAQNAVGNITPQERIPFASGLMSSVMSLGPFVGPYVFAASMALVPSWGENAAFIILMAAAFASAAFGLAHPMRALKV